MKTSISLLAISAALFAASCNKKDTGTSPTSTGNTMSFFVSSRTSVTGNLGGLRGADAICQSLGATAGQGTKTWRAYLTAIGQVGHSDGLGPGGSAAGPLSSWNSSHTNQNCSNTAPRGGAGRIYCFAR